METRKNLVLSRENIADKVRDLGKDITRDYQGCELIAIGILKGAFIFMADLVREIDLPLQVDFIRAASYGAETFSSGEIRLKKDIELSLENKDVLLIEDIVDTGRTLAFLKEHILNKKPRTLRICALIDKSERREVPVEVDYPGFSIDQGFLVGYGLDCAEQFRQLPEISQLLT